MTQATINGNIYSDDGTSARDMLNGGHRQWFLPMVGDVTVVAGVVAGQAAQVALDAVTATDGANALKGTSTTSLTVAAGVQTITTQSGKQFTVGNYLTISRTSAPETLMHGVVTSYSGATLVVEVSNIAGSGTYTDWTIALSGPQGVTGPSGEGQITRMAKTGNYTVTATDKAKVIECDGTFTLSFQACATLGSTWATWIKNTGTGHITLDPNGSELINGAATDTLYPNMTMLVQCDGTALRTVVNTGTALVRLPILSTATVGRNAASVLENIDGDYVDTGLTGAASMYATYDTVEGLFVVTVGTASSQIATSPDGTTWTLRTMPSSGIWRVLPGPSGWFAYIINTTTCAFSDNAGVSWTARSAAPVSIAYIARLAARILIVAGSSTTAHYSDNEGVSWTSATLASTTNKLGSVGSVFVSHGTTGIYYTSATGETGTWTSRSYPYATAAGFIKSSVTGALLAGVSSDGLTPLYQTTDGVTWTEIGDFTGNVANMIGPINGVYAYFITPGVSSSAATYHRMGVPVTRTSGITTSGIYSAYNGVGIHVLGGYGVVMVINESTYSKTGLFEV